ncbi:MAG: Protein translocase subunit SecY [Candidatus Woesearchaeota archaeon]|nr:Protein translocase subunit SecY [Candidatus Woesearchaeota archaeon]
MSVIRKLLMNLPEVRGPTQKRLPFKEKLKWTAVTIVLFFVLGMIPLFGLDQANQFQFEQLEIILGASFGSLISLGIGPLVTSSIVLQLLTGAGLLKLDLNNPDDKAFYQGLQKIASIFFILFEGIIYVFMGGLAPPAALAGTRQYLILQILLVIQLFIGGFLIMFMDEVISKWGFGSGISLFIASGVSKAIFLSLLSPFNSTGKLFFISGGEPIGKLIQIFYFLPQGSQGMTSVLIAITAILATVIVFAISIFGQAMKIEIPLSFGRVRGQGIRWPLNFIYTSNIPVILVSAFMANIQLWARLLQNWGKPILGTFVGNQPSTGFVTWLSAPNIMQKIVTSSLTFSDISHALVYMLIMIGGAIIFSLFWVQTSGMDARSQAKNMMSSGLHIPGFRKDERILERILSRYILPLTVMGAIFVGFLAGIADLMGALARGTGILLAVMIIYKLYEEIAKEHMMDMHPALRKFVKN